MGGERMSFPDDRSTIVQIQDKISGYCPACNSAAIGLVCDVIAGNQKYMIRKYVLGCKHMDVCMLRRDFMEGDDV